MIIGSAISPFSIDLTAAAVRNGMLLLDSFGGSLAGYSPARKLRAAYSGASMKVRRSSDNAELDIGFSVNELDQAALLAHVGAGSGFITTLYDQSGNGFNATQTTAAKQPRIVNSGTVDVLNGKPAMFFDGTNDFLDCGTINGGTKPANFSAFIVFSTTNISGNKYAFASLLATNQDSYLAGALTGSTIFTLYGDDTDFRNTQTASSAVAATTQYVFSYTYTSGNGPTTIHLNGGGDIAATDTGDATACSGTERKSSIGRAGEANSSYWGGFIQDVVPYATDQVGNREGIVANLNNFYTVF